MVTCYNLQTNIKITIYNIYSWINSHKFFLILIFFKKKDPTISQRLEETKSKKGTNTESSTWSLSQNYWIEKFPVWLRKAIWEVPTILFVKLLFIGFSIWHSFNFHDLSYIFMLLVSFTRKPTCSSTHRLLFFHLSIF